jgi:hypothetical protein
MPAEQDQTAANRVRGGGSRIRRQAKRFFANLDRAIKLPVRSQGGGQNVEDR